MRWYNIVGYVALVGPLVIIILAMLMTILIEQPYAIFIILCVAVWVIGSVYLVTKE